MWPLPTPSPDIMKPTLLFLFVAGAILALLSTWWLLGSSSSVPYAAEGGLGADQEMAVTAPNETLLDDVEPQPDGERAADAGDRRSLAPRGNGTRPAGPTAVVRAPATGPYFGRLIDPLGRPMGAIEISIDSWENASRDSGGVMAFGAGRRSTSATATTGDDGRFAVTTKKSLGRSLGVTSTVAGFSDDPIQCVLDPEKGRDLGDVTLSPAVLVSGWVRDAEERAIAGARVRRVDRNGDMASDLMDEIGFGGLVEAARTDADGRFEMLHEDEGAITLQIDGDDILPKRWDGPTRRAGEVLQDVVIKVERAGHIDGYVIGYPSDRKRGLVAAAILDHVEEGSQESGISELLSAQLSPAGDHTASIEADGSFTLSGLVPGARYRLRAITKNFFVRTVELSAAVDARVGDEPATLEFDPGTALTFRAIDAKTQEPIEVLTLSGKYGTQPAFLQLTPTAGNPPDRYPGGKVTIYELRPKNGPQELTLTIDAPGYFRTRDVTALVPAAGTVNLGKIALAPAPLLKFRVIDAATRKPVRRARVTVEPTNPAQFNFGGRLNRNEGEATDEEKEEQEAVEAMVLGEYRQRSRDRTNAKGLCSLSMVEAQQVTLEVKARGYATFVQAPFFAPENGEDEMVVIELLGGGSLQAFVSDTEGDPAASVHVECRRETGERVIKKKEKTDENGIADFENLTDGAWEVRAFRPDNSLFAESGRGSASHETEWVTVRVARGTRSRVDLEVPAMGDLTGSVLLAGLPAPDVRVSLTPPESVDRAEQLLELQDQFAGLNPDTTTGVTDFEGHFALTDVIPGEYILLTRHPDLAMAVRTEVTVAAGANTATVEIAGTALEGRVVDDEGSPIAGAAVSIDRRIDDEAASERSMSRQFLGSKRSASATTDIDGVYKLLGVTSDVDLIVAVEASGYADARHGPIQARADETVPVAPIALERAGAVVVTTQSETNTSTMAFVRARPLAGRAFEMDAEDKVGILRAGTARLDGLIAGTWEVTVQFISQDPGQQGGPTTLVPKTVEVKPGETAELKI